MRWAGAMLAAIAILLAWFGYNERNAATAQRMQLEQQTTYLCAVARSLDPIVLAASKSPGLTPAQRQQFRAAHIILSQTEPCQEVEG